MAIEGAFVLQKQILFSYETASKSSSKRSKIDSSSMEIANKHTKKHFLCSKFLLSFLKTVFEEEIKKHSIKFVKIKINK